MKIFFISAFFLSLFLMSCSNSQNDSTFPISYAQLKIQNLVDTFKMAVRQEKDLNMRDSIRYKYSYRFFDLLSNIYIDSIRVHIDSVIVEGLTVTTEFHCNNEVSFRSSLRFLPKMDSAQVSLFEFMKGLKPGFDTMVNFSYMGGHQVRLPNSNGTPILRVFAYPSPIQKKKIINAHNTGLIQPGP